MSPLCGHGRRLYQCAPCYMAGGQVARPNDVRPPRPSVPSPLPPTSNGRTGSKKVRDVLASLRSEHAGQPDTDPASGETHGRPLGWHVIEGGALLGLLRRVAAGESPDAVYAGAWANADHEAGR